MLVADIAHIAGLIAGGAHPSPVGARRRHLDHHAQDAARPARRDAHVHAPSTPRRIDTAVFPGLQGGPHNHTTAGDRGRAARGGAAGVRRLRPRRSSPTRRRSATALIERGFDLVSGGTDNHLILVDLTDQGRRRASPPRKALDRAGHRAATTTPSRSTRASRSTRPASASARPAVTTRGMTRRAHGRGRGAGSTRASRPRGADDEAALERIRSEVLELARGVPAAGSRRKSKAASRGWVRGRVRRPPSCLGVATRHQDGTVPRNRTEPDPYPAAFDVRRDRLGGEVQRPQLLGVGHRVAEQPPAGLRPRRRPSATAAASTRAA